MIIFFVIAFSSCNNLCTVLVLMISFCSLAFANIEVKCPIVILEMEAKDDVNFILGNETDPDGNETDPNGNETEDPDGNETEDPNSNETEDPDGNETEEEIEIMNNTLGAEIRLLQLEKAITKNIIIGERSIAVLQAMGYNTTDLEVILDELRLVLEEVQAVNVIDNDSIQQFVDLKSDARKLTKEFRETIKDLLSDQKIKDLKEQIRDIFGDSLQNYSKRIQNKIKQFNRNQIHRLYGIMGETNETLAQAYLDGNVSAEEAKSQISKMVNMMTKQKRNQIFSELKKGKINDKNFADEEMEDVMQGFDDRQNDRSNNRGGKGNNSKGNGRGPK